MPGIKGIWGIIIVIWFILLCVLVIWAYKEIRTQGAICMKDPIKYGFNALEKQGISLYCRCQQFGKPNISITIENGTLYEVKNIYPFDLSGGDSDFEINLSLN